MRALCIMKNVAIFILSFLVLLIGSISFWALRDIAIAQPKYPIPDWSVEDLNLLNAAYKELGARNLVPVRSFPYRIDRGNDRVIIKFRDAEYLRVLDSKVIGVEINDGCVFYTFDLQMNYLSSKFCG